MDVPWPSNTMILENELEKVEKEEAMVCLKVISGYFPWRKKKEVIFQYVLGTWNLRSVKY